MRCVRRARLGIDHLLRVAVVGSNQQDVARVQDAGGQVCQVDVLRREIIPGTAGGEKGALIGLRVVDASAFVSRCSV